MFDRDSNIAIHNVLNLFEKGDLSLLELISNSIDLRIDHYRDSADISWQQCKDKAGFIELLTRLGKEIFPKGTVIEGLKSIGLGDGWHFTTFDQCFWYGLEERDVASRTYIVSHELNGQIDYFRENVTALVHKT